jgi:hypothetical protein
VALPRHIHWQAASWLPLTWRGQRFQVWVTNPETVQQILNLQQGKSDAAIPSGRILRAPGQGAHNVRWSWHMDPEDIQMAEFTVEVCDGLLRLWRARWTTSSTLCSATAPGAPSCWEFRTTVSRVLPAADWYPAIMEGKHYDQPGRRANADRGRL